MLYYSTQLYLSEEIKVNKDETIFFVKKSIKKVEPVLSLQLFTLNTFISDWGKTILHNLDHIIAFQYILGITQYKYLYTNKICDD